MSYREDALRIDGQAIKRLQLTNTAIARASDDPEIWRETLTNGAAYRIMLPQHAMTGKLEGEVVLDDGVFLVGDNRYASYDSRQSGATDPGQVRGKALIVLESAHNDGILMRFLKWID